MISHYGLCGSLIEAQLKGPFPVDALVTHRRQNLPPLRYKGRIVARARVAFVRTQSIVIEIWSRNRGGFVLVYSVFGSGKLETDALVLPSLERCITRLETICDRLESQLQHSQMSIKYLSALRFRQAFEILVGEFLASLIKDQTAQSGDGL